MNFCSSDGPNLFMGGGQTELIGDLVQKLKQEKSWRFSRAWVFRGKICKVVAVFLHMAPVFSDGKADEPEEVDEEEGPIDRDEKDLKVGANPAGNGNKK